MTKGIYTETIKNLDKAKEIFDKFFNGSIKVYVTQSKSVVSCTRCEGTGFLSHEELSDYHKREYMTIVNGCDHCLASGRQVKVISKIRFDATYPFGDASTEKVEYVPYPNDPITNPHETVVSSSILINTNDDFDAQRSYLTSLNNK